MPHPGPGTMGPEAGVCPRLAGDCAVDQTGAEIELRPLSDLPPVRQNGPAPHLLRGGDQRCPERHFGGDYTAQGRTPLVGPVPPGRRGVALPPPRWQIVLAARSLLLRLPA